MEAQEFIELVEAPEKAKEKGIDELKKLAHDFPYSQPIQLMYAIRLRKSSEHLFNQQLGRASILTNDRSVLFDLFEQGGKSTLTEQEESEILHPKPDLPKHFTPTASPVFSPEPEEEENVTETFEQQQEVEKPATPIKKFEVVNEREDAADEDEQEDAPVKIPQAEEAEPEEAPKKETPRKEKDIEALPADQRIRAILEKNRQLREDFESKKQKDESPLSEMDLRLQKIREKLSELKQPYEKSAEANVEKDWSEKLPAVPEPTPLEAAEADEQTEEIAEKLTADVSAEAEQKAVVEEEIQPVNMDEEASIRSIDFRIEADETEEPAFNQEHKDISKKLSSAAAEFAEEPLLEEEALVQEHQQEPDYNVLVDGAFNQKSPVKEEEDETSDADIADYKFAAEFETKEDEVLEEAAQLEERNRYEDDTIRLVERADAEEESQEKETHEEEPDAPNLQEVLEKESHVAFSVEEDVENAGELEREVILQEKRSSEEAELMLVELADEAEDNVEENAGDDEVETDQQEEEEENYDGDEEEEFDPLRDKYRLTPLDLDEDLIKEVSERRTEEKMSFGDWLKKLNKGGGSSVERVKGKLISNEEVEKPAAFEEKVQLLDSFVEKLPTLKKKKIEAGPPTTPAAIGKLVNKGETASLVTETLAGVYTEQRHYDKAIKAYEILKLKYPEKSSFFAARISDVKKLKNNK